MSGEPIDSEDYYYSMYDRAMDQPDVFEELLEINKIRRFSFSIPEEYNIFDEELDFILRAPPPTPTAPLASSNTFTTDNYTISTHNKASLKDIQSTLDYPKQVLFITSLDDRHVYKIPSAASIDAYKIWNQAGIPRKAYANTIESQLLDWAYTYAQLEIVDRKIVTIKWIITGNSECEARWPAFLKWILCASVGTPK